MKSKTLSVFLCLALTAALLSGCAAETDSAADPAPATAAPQAETVSVTTEQEADAVITFTPEGAKIEGGGVEIDGDGEVDVQTGGTYIVTGESDSGRIVVDASAGADVTVILAGCDLTYADDEVIYFKSAASGTVLLAAGTENILTSGEAPAEEDPGTAEDASGAALRAKCPLTIGGEGSLTVCGYINNGIAASGNLTVNGGAINITAQNDGLKSDGDIVINGGSLAIAAAQDGVQSGGELTVNGGDIAVVTGSGAEEAAMKVSDSLMMGMGGSGGGRGRRASGEANAEAEDADANDTSGTEPPAEDEEDSEAASEEMQRMRDFFDAWDADSSDSGSRKGLKAGTAIALTGGSIILDTEDDAVHSDGDVTITGGVLTARSGDDGVHADDRLAISGGTVDVQYCYEGLEAANILITDGVVSIVATDDGMNVNGGSFGFPGGPSGEASGETESENAETETIETVLRITGGVVTVDSGGDGLDSNGSIYIEGGTVYVSGPSTNWDAAIDYGEGSSEFVITGGTIIATGYSGMAEAPDAAENAQPSIYYAADEYASDGAAVTLKDAAGNVIAEGSFAHSFNCVVISSPDLAVGETYTLTMDDAEYTIELTDTNYSNRARGGMGGFPGGGSREASGEAEQQVSTGE